VTGALGFSDAAKRCSDWVNLHIAALDKDSLMRGRYIGVRLADGYSNGETYATWAEASRYHEREMMPYYFIKIPLTGMTVMDAEELLKGVRALYDAGMRFTDPAVELALPTTREGLSSLSQ
jgi:hypothetical protein